MLRYNNSKNNNNKNNSSVSQYKNNNSVPQYKNNSSVPQYKNNNLILRPPNTQSRILSIIVLVSFLTAMVGGAYGYSLDKGKISENKFTVSQALAYGNKGIMVSLFLISLIATVLLNYVRGGTKKLLMFRIFCVFLIYTLMIILIWVTVASNKTIHFNIAGTIFTFITVYVITISYIYNHYLNKYSSDLMVLDLNIVLLYSSFVLLLVFGVFEPNEKSEFNNIMFASNENITIFLNFLPLYYLGFV